MITLALETSTTLGSVALLADSALLLDETFSADRRHSATLFEVLARARALTDHVDCIAVGLGPGSFAGVRIAIAAALGLELALGAKLVGLPSVVALAVEPEEYFAIGDARREAFYFTQVARGRCVEGPLLLSAAELAGRLSADLTRPIFATAEVPGFPTAILAQPSAALLARLAAADSGIVARDVLEPIYLREPHITWPKVRPGIPLRP